MQKYGIIAVLYVNKNKNSIQYSSKSASLVASFSAFDAGMHASFDCIESLDQKRQAPNQHVLYSGCTVQLYTTENTERSFRGFG